MEKFKFKKKYGQNFLYDQNIINKIANIIEVQEDDLIIEIGPGSGKLTEKLIKFGSFYLAYEIDLDTKEYLDKYKTEKVKIIYKDILNANIFEDIKDISYKNIYVIANLPYYITTPILTKLIDSKIPISKEVIMVQKEVADRFSAKPGSREYGSITVYLNCYFKINKKFEVPRGCFIPAPNVDSTILLLEKDEKLSGVNEEVLFKLIKDAFQFKRKQLKNNLKDYDLNLINETLIKYNLNVTTRAENIPVKVFIELAKVISNKN